MATMNVSLPDAMKEWVEDQTQSGSYGNSSDYVRDLIRQDQERKRKIAAMDVLVEEAIASGLGSMTMQEIRQAGRRKAGLDAG
jgi:antitoxin ParD1/3/4